MNQLAQQAILRVIDIVGRKWVENSNRPENPNDITKDTLGKLTDFEKEIRETRDSVKHIEQIKESENQERDTEVRNKYSNYAPDMNIATGCITCSRAHILGVRGSLREALRFAREDGINHDEVIKRLDNAAEELVIMERFDLTPEQIERSPQEEKEKIQIVLPKIRELRQKIINEINGVKDLEEAAALASDVYNDIRYRLKKTG